MEQARNGNGGRNVWIAVATVLAVACIASTYIAARSWVGVKTREVRTIEVTGSAKRRITSDLIQWEAQLQTKGSDRTQAYGSLKENVAKTLAFFQAQGIKPEDIQVSAVSNEEIIEHETVGNGEDRFQRPIHRGYTVWQTIKITSHDVAKVEKLSRESTQLLEQGVPIESLEPKYFYTKLGELKIEMLAEASKDARVRADRILDSAGGAHVGKIVSADMGVINVNPANSTAGSWDGNNDMTSLEKDIITIVHVVFEMS